MNRVEISGNLARDIEVRTSTTGMSIGNFTIAVNDRIKNNQTGQWENYPNWINCTIFGARCDGLAPYLTKGQKVLIAGRLHYSSWEKDGETKSRISVNVDDIELIRAKRADEPAETSEVADDDGLPF